MVSILRYIHVIAGAAWLGEVVVIVFVLVPTVIRADEGGQRWLLATLFPRIFRLASVLILVALTAGALLNLAMSDWSVDWPTLTGTHWGRSILSGGSLGLALGLFHFIAERRLEPMTRAEGALNIDKLVRRLRYIPRVGLVLLTVIFTLMIQASG